MRISGLILCLLLLLQSCDTSNTTEQEQPYSAAIEAYSHLIQADSLYDQAKEMPKSPERKKKIQEVWDLIHHTLQNPIPDSLKIKAYQQRTNISSRLFHIDSTIALTHAYEKLAMQMKDSSMLADAYYRLCFYYRIPNAMKAALKYGNKSLALAKKINDSTTFYKGSVTLGNFLLDHGHNVEAEKIALNGLSYAREDKERVKLFNVLAISSAGQYDYQEKVYWLQEALKLMDNMAEQEESEEEQQERVAMQLVLSNNLAMGYYRLENQKEKALAILEELKAHPLYNQDPVEMSRKLRSDRARVLSNLALVRADLGLEGSLEMYEEARQIWTEVGSTYNLASLYYRLAMYYRNDLGKARELALQSLGYARENTLVQEELDALALLVEIDPRPKAYALKFQKLTDSIIRQNKVTGNNITRFLYDLERTREENLRYETMTKEQEAELQRSRIRSLALGVCLVLFLAGGLQTYRLISTRHRLQQSEEIRKTESRISKRIHDELANDLYCTMTFAQMNELGENQSKEKLLDNLEDLYKRTRNISRENAGIPLGEEFGGALHSLIAQYRNTQTNIVIKGLKDINWSKVPGFKQEALYRSLQELLVNMNKHANASLVVLQFNQQGQKLFISYKDNGKGMPAEIPTNGGGLQNIHSRLTQTGGRFKLESAKGKGVKVEMVYG